MIEEWQEIKVPTNEEEAEELKVFLQEQHQKDIA